MLTRLLNTQIARRLFSDPQHVVERPHAVRPRGVRGALEALECECELEALEFECELEALVVRHEALECELEALVVRHDALVVRHDGMELRVLREERERELRVEPVIVVRARQELRREADRGPAGAQADDEAQHEDEGIHADAPRLDALDDSRGDGAFEGLIAQVGRRGRHDHEMTQAPPSYIRTRRVMSAGHLRRPSTSSRHLTRASGR